jgi:hypothetical protein
VLFLLFGSSAAGKTYVLSGLRDRVGGVAIHDFDEIGVPAGADSAWRQRANEAWVRRAVEYQAEGRIFSWPGRRPSASCSPLRLRGCSRRSRVA